MELNINEIFASFQGEGVHTGIPTVFIRLAGCNLRCRWCDTAYAIEPSSGIPMSISDILSKVSGYGLGVVCLTGGEPLLQSGSIELVDQLLSNGIRVDIETNGSLDIGPYIGKGEDAMLSMDVKTPSSGMESSLLVSNISLLRPVDQLKFVVKDDDDIQYAVGIIRKHLPRCTVLFTPEGNENIEPVADLILKKVLTGELPSEIRFMLQMHKVIWKGDRRAV